MTAGRPHYGRAQLQRWLAEVAGELDARFDDWKYASPGADGRPLSIVPYRGYGSPRQVHLRGRVLAYEPVTPAGPDESLWTHLANTYRRFESDEAPGVRLRATCRDASQEIETDNEGYFGVSLAPGSPFAEASLWQTVELELLTPVAGHSTPARATGEVLTPPPSAALGIISDIDDTVVQTNATQLLSMLRNVFLRNAHARLPFPGIAELCRALFAGTSGIAANPLFYVSSSPWNLYDLLCDFFQLHDIPIGPVLFLRDWGLDDLAQPSAFHTAHKSAIIQQLLDFYSSLPFILIGDSGQHDPEIYHAVVQRYPGRIRAVYIRDVVNSHQRDQSLHPLAEAITAAGTAFVLASDTVTLANHAAAQGWITPAALARVTTAQAG